MLVKIECDKFASEHQKFPINPGLNTVLGSSNGSNAIGKSTFLWIVDYAFGGDYYTKLHDIKKEIGSHFIYFTFLFGDQPHYFYRSTDDTKHVIRCDEKHHKIEELKLEDYRKFLFSEYQIMLPSIEFSNITERYFRIYGRENTLEKYPLHKKTKEKDEDAVDFLLQLFGHNKILVQIQSMLDVMGTTLSQLATRRQMVDTEKIEQNKKAINAQKKRLREQMQKSADVQMMEFGFDTKTFEKIEEAKKELNACMRSRNRLQSQLNAIKENISIYNADAVSEFNSLLHFFPNTDIKALCEIEYFHKQIRAILCHEISQEIERLQPIIARCDNEIKRLQKKMEDSGLVREMSVRIITQCVSISKTIDELEEENSDLERQLELQQARAENERRLTNLLKQQSEKIKEIQDNITLSMERINSAITDGQETAPLLKISPQKTVTFETPGSYCSVGTIEPEII
jgi:hypothetical protein